MSIFKTARRPEDGTTLLAPPVAASPALLPPPAGTVIGTDIALTGSLTGRGDVCIEGKLDGEMRIDGALFVAEGAVVNAAVSATSIKIAGCVTGNVHARKVEITSTGKVYGDLDVQSLLIGEGAVYEGRSKMAADHESSQIAAFQPDDSVRETA